MSTKQSFCFDCMKAFKTCAETTGHHGVNQVAITNRPTLRAIWTIITAFGYGMFIWHVYTLICRYLEHPVTTVILYKKVSFQFPDITVCPLLPFSLKMIEHQFGSLNILSEMENPHMIDHVVGTAYLRTEDFFVNCMYNEMPCNLSKIEMIDDPLYKHCFLIKGGGVTVRSKATESGLNLILFIDNQHNHPLPQISGANDTNADWESTGVRVVVHEPGTHPHPSLNGVYASAGTDLKLALSIEQVSLVPTIDRTTGAPKCVEQRKNATYCHEHNNNGATYLETQDDCISSKIQRYIFQQCGCVSERYDIPDGLCDAPHCSNLNSNCGVSMLAGIADMFERFTKECRSLCKTYNWNMRLSAAEWPSHISEEHIFQMVLDAYHRSRSIHNFSALEEIATINPVESDIFNMLQRNLVKLTIYPEALSGNQIYEELAYPLNSFLSEVGGILGLWLGCSVLTIFEPVTAFYNLSQTRKCCRKKSKQPIARAEAHNSNSFVMRRDLDGNIDYIKVNVSA